MDAEDLGDGRGVKGEVAERGFCGAWWKWFGVKWWVWFGGMVVKMTWNSGGNGDDGIRG